MPTGQSPTETNGPISAEAIDYGIVETRISKMETLERSRLQREIRESWSRVTVRKIVRFGSVRGDGVSVNSHYFAPLGFVVDRWYK